MSDTPPPGITAEQAMQAAVQARAHLADAVVNQVQKLLAEAGLLPAEALGVLELARAIKVEEVMLRGLRKMVRDAVTAPTILVPGGFGAPN